MILRVVATAGLAAALGGAGNAAPAQSPAAAREITNGIDDAFACTVKYAVASQAWSCALAGQRANAQMHPDHLAYDVGYYFQSWHDLDLDWTSDVDLAKSGHATAAPPDEDERETRAMYRLYCEARNRLGITDAHILSITTMNPEGKARAAARLEFWAKRGR
jgi:hypothetical protein